MGKAKYRSRTLEYSFVSEKATANAETVTKKPALQNSHKATNVTPSGRFGLSTASSDSDVFAALSMCCIFNRC